MPRFVTPQDNPEGFVSRQLAIPDSQRWLGVFSEALSQLTYAHNYQQNNPADLTPEEAAEIALAAYVAWLEAAECGAAECPPASINSKRVVRLNRSTGHFEQVTDDSFGWEPPDEGYAVPAQAGRAEPTDDEKKCAAATNAAHVMKLLYDQSLADFHLAYSAEEAFDSFAGAAGDLIFSALTALIQGLGPWVAFVWDAFFIGIELISDNVWTAGFEERLTCLFLANATIAGDVVTFDFQAINRAIVMEPVASFDEILWIAQVEYMLFIIGADGLNLAGETTAVAGACSGCDEWCVIWDSAHNDIVAGGWELFEGVEGVDGKIYPSAYGVAYDGAFKRLGIRRTVATVDCEVTWIGVRLFVASGAPTSYHYRQVTNETGLNLSSPNVINSNPGSAYAYHSGGEVGDTTTGASSEITLRLTCNGTPNMYLAGVQLRGTGINPFVTGTAC